MAQKSNKSGGFAVIPILIIALALIATPIVMILGTIYSVFSYLLMRNKIQGVYSDFWLDTSEKLEFKTVATKLVNAVDNIEKAEKIGNKEGLAHNKDGSFSLRGNRGKKIQEIISDNESIEVEYYPTYNYLKDLPQVRWDKFRSIYSRFYSFLFSTLAWLITAGILVFYLFHDLVFGFNKLISFPIDLLKSLVKLRVGKDVDTSILILQCEVLSISAAICLIVYIIAHYILKSRAENVTPIPPEVTLKNFDKY